MVIGIFRNYNWNRRVNEANNSEIKFVGDNWGGLFFTIYDVYLTKPVPIQKNIRFVILNAGSINLGKNFTVQYKIDNVLYTTNATLGQDLIPGSSPGMSITTNASGELQWIKVYSSICPGQSSAEKEIT